MIPRRISLITYNLWNTQYWPERSSSLKAFLVLYQPDILCVQELRQETRSFLDQNMPTHSRVEDDYPGWTSLSNIYWNKNYFEEVVHGVENIGSIDDCVLFWTRLKMKRAKEGGSPEQTLFVSTAHFTYPENPKEIESGINPRIHEAKQTAKFLKTLVKPGEPAFFMGDLNDPVVPYLVFPEAGFQSCFDAMKTVCPPTFPFGNRVIDWLYANQNARAISASVPHFFHDATTDSEQRKIEKVYQFHGITPSDHWPIQAVYEI